MLPFYSLGPRNFLNEDARFDTLNPWINPYDYRFLHQTGGRRKEESGGGGADGEPAEVLLVSGTVRADGSAGRLDPAFSFTSPLPPAASSGSAPHCLRYFGGEAEIGRHCFNPAPPNPADWSGAG